MLYIERMARFQICGLTKWQTEIRETHNICSYLLVYRRIEFLQRSLDIFQEEFLGDVDLIGSSCHHNNRISAL